MLGKIIVTNETHATIPNMAFRRIARTILGNTYLLSVVFASSSRMKKLNLIYRNKKVATDILSFPLSKSEGEIYVCPIETRKQSKKFDRPYKNFLAFLFIHGCVHLKGYDHSGTMESIEAKLRSRFGI